MQLIGRKEEQRELARYCESDRSEFVVVYGRRRVGKTYLVRQFFANQFAFYATGIAGANMAAQIRGFNATLKRFGGRGDAKDWIDAFEQLRILLESGEAYRDPVGGKLVVFIDEMPWLDTPRSSFTTALDFFWNSWASARDDILLIVCGSATSWIVKNLFKNRGGLHNRVTGRIHLSPFSLGECEKMLQGNGIVLSRQEIIEAYMVFGGVPYYLELFDRRLSLDQNIDRLCFNRDGQLRNEFEELFKSLFRHADRHIAIVRSLASRESGMSRADLLDSSGLSDGGTFTNTLSELEQCGFVRGYQGYPRDKRGEMYQLIDPFTLFWLRFVERQADEHWWSVNRSSAGTRSWNGHAFELVCLLHVPQILRALGVWGVSVNACSWRSESADPGAQIDLVLDRADGVIDLCEMKWMRSGEEYAIDRAYSQALLHKMEAFSQETATDKALHIALVTPGGVKRNSHSGVVTSQITSEDLFA